MDPLKRLVGELSRLPGIGPKTATRLAHHLLRISDREARALADAIVEVKERLGRCITCHAITADERCSICTDPLRDRRTLCVVEEPFNIEPIERTGEFHGLYHVLHGSLAPHRGIGPDHLTIGSLLGRLDGVEEVVLATNPDVEGEATALYIRRQLAPFSLRVTRLGFGLPVGGDIEYTDEVTLSRAFAARRELS